MNRKIGIVGPEMFDEKFYRHAYMDAEHFKGNVYCHYVKIGGPQNRLPSREIFRQVYPLFNLKIYRGLSQDLKFEYKEQYYSHFHHCGFDQNKYFGFRNKMFVNRGRLCVTTGKIYSSRTSPMCCPRTGPVFPNPPCCQSHASRCCHSPHKHKHKHHKHDHHDHHDHDHDHKDKHIEKSVVRYKPIIRKSVVRNLSANKNSVTEFKAANPQIPPAAPKLDEIGTLTDIVTRTNEAISIIARIKKERETAVKVIDGAENAIKTIYSTIDNDSSIMPRKSAKKSVYKMGESTPDQNTVYENIIIPPPKSKRIDLPKISSLNISQSTNNTLAGKRKSQTSVTVKSPHIEPKDTVLPKNSETPTDISISLKENSKSPKEVNESPEGANESPKEVNESPKEVNESPKGANESPEVNTDTKNGLPKMSMVPQNTVVKRTMGDSPSSLVWSDINLLPYARSTNGNFTYREFVKFNYSEDGSIIIQQLALPVNEGIEFTAELPRNWKNNTMIVPHLHWTPTTDMYGMTESINLTWMIKSVGTAFEDSDKSTKNTFNQLIKIGPEKNKVHVQTNFVAGTPVDLVGHNHIIVGHLRRLTGNSSYTDDIFIVGLDLSIIVDANHTDT